MQRDNVIWMRSLIHFYLVQMWLRCKDSAVEWIDNVALHIPVRM
jgi:hypothetical protein